MIQRRDIVVSIILSFITCGLYGIYWLVCLTNDVNTVCDTPNDTSGVMVVILNIFTCGLYGFYWVYKMGEKLDARTNTSDKKLIYLVLYLFGFAIIADALIQDTLNKLA